MKKRILVATLTMAAACGLCACGTKNTSENSQVESADVGEEKSENTQSESIGLIAASQLETESSDEGETDELVKKEDLKNGSVKWEDILNSPEMLEEILNIDNGKTYYFNQVYCHQYTEAGSADWTMGKLIVNGQSITMPCAEEELEALGYSTTERDSGNELNCTNGNGQQIKVSKRSSFSEKFDDIIIQSEFGNTVDIGGITFGMSVAECMDNLGKPYECTPYSIDDQMHLTYQLEDNSYHLQLDIDKEKGLSEIWLICY